MVVYDRISLHHNQTQSGMNTIPAQTFLDRHPAVKSAMAAVDANPEHANKRGGYWRDAMIEEIAQQVYKSKCDNALHDAEMILSFYEEDNGD